MIGSLVQAIRVVSGVCRSGKRPPPQTCPSKQEDVEKYRRRIPTIHITRDHICAADSRQGGASGLRTMPDPDLHASPPTREVDPGGERGHVSHTGGARATEVPVGGRAVVRAHLRDGC